MSDTPEQQTDASPAPSRDRGRTVHGEPANAGHRVLAPDDAEVEAYLETALNAPLPVRAEEEAPSEPDTVIVLDFGSQYAQLIARRIRELHVYSELLPHDTPWAEIERRKPKAIVLSGGPASVYDEGAPQADPGPRHLLRAAADGAPARWRGGSGLPTGVRAGIGHPHGR